MLLKNLLLSAKPSPTTYMDELFSLLLPYLN